MRSSFLPKCHAPASFHAFLSTACSVLPVSRKYFGDSTLVVCLHFLFLNAFLTNDSVSTYLAIAIAHNGRNVCWLPGCHRLISFCISVPSTLYRQNDFVEMNLVRMLPMIVPKPEKGIKEVRQGEGLEQSAISLSFLLRHLEFKQLNCACPGLMAEEGIPRICATTSYVSFPWISRYSVSIQSVSIS